MPTEDGRIEIAVVGAHLSGLALNSELLDRGARFVRQAVTRPDYRLFALSGGAVQRPGLLHVTEGAGAAIVCEVWSLPCNDFARFVEAVPSPLSIGTLRLDDGTQPKGFLVEAEGIRGAQDISAHGGWRAFLAAREAA